ncbi:MAG TPA: thiamine pyrophosphate-dependent enzyme [Oculatellaceae cyanobacterium]|jgi:2-oxoglutarate ferredoxin oxidoreductase subunit beta
MASSQSLLKTPLKGSQLKSDIHSEWCPGCGDYGITNSIQQAIAALGLKPWETFLVSGVGCSGKVPHYVHVYGMHTLHGRALAFAQGAKIANPNLTVIAAGGDGDGYGIGAGHFVHAGRRNVDMTYVVFNNEVYGLTKGQASPTLAQGAQPKSLALPNPTTALNPIALALACGYTFIARSYAFDAKHLKETLMKAIQHKGVALVDVLQPCPTYNNLHTKDYFAEMVEVEGAKVPRVYYLEDDGYDGRVKDPNDIHEVNAKQAACFERAHRVEERVALGVFYQIEKPTFQDTLKRNIPMLNEFAPVELPYYDPKTGLATTDISKAAADYVI